VTESWQSNCKWNLKLLSSAIISWIKQSLYIGLCHRRTTLFCLFCPISKYKLYIHRRVLINFCLFGLNNHVQSYYFNLRDGGVSEIYIFKIAGPCLDGQEQTTSFCYNLLFKRIKYVFLPRQLFLMTWISVWISLSIPN